ncbi:MAG: hypothetical protein II021_04505, partial [Oscillospiraceae bacterium]|nr:hypothetical protein [Oscillospiraceae bacterium]
ADNTFVLSRWLTRAWRKNARQNRVLIGTVSLSFYHIMRLISTLFYLYTYYSKLSAFSRNAPLRLRAKGDKIKKKTAGGDLYA